MSKQLDNLITILRDSSSKKSYTEGLCRVVVCDDIPCEDCPFDSTSALKEVIKEMEVLHYAKA